MFNYKNMFGVRVDEVEIGLDAALESIIKDKNNLIVPIDVPLLLKVRKNPELRRIVNSAALVIPIDKTLSPSYSINEFNLYNKILTYIDNKELSLFIFGTKEIYSIRIFDMLKRLYPKIVNVGFYDGKKYKKSKEKDSILEGIRKISPDVLAVQMKFPKSIIWYNDNKDSLNTKIYMPSGKSFDVFSGQMRTPPYEVIQKNSRGYYFKKNPFLLLTYLNFYMIKFFYRLTRKAWD